jgi:hypothetical protein
VEHRARELGRTDGAQEAAQARQRGVVADPVVQYLLSAPPHAAIRTYIRSNRQTLIAGRVSGTPGDVGSWQP